MQTLKPLPTVENRNSSSAMIPLWLLRKVIESTSLSPDVVDSVVVFVVILVSYSCGIITAVAFQNLCQLRKKRRRSEQKFIKSDKSDSQQKRFHHFVKTDSDEKSSFSHLQSPAVMQKTMAVFAVDDHRVQLRHPRRPMNRQHAYESSSATLEENNEDIWQRRNDNQHQQYYSNLSNSKRSRRYPTCSSIRSSIEGSEIGFNVNHKRRWSAFPQSDVSWRQLANHYNENYYGF